MLNKIKRKFTQIFNIKLSSEPFISGDTFRILAKHFYEKGNLNIKTQKVKEGDIVFVQSFYLEDFFTKIHPAINSRYKLVSHNGDVNITDKYLKYIDSKIIVWYAQNVDIEHNKIVPIPIGLENLNYYTNGIVNKFRNSTDNVPKLDKILVMFSIHTNPKERQKAYDNLKDNPCVTLIKEKLSFDEYFSLLKQHKFVASPKGNGLDCHRTWEALYVNTIPITTESIGLNSFKLPIYIIEEWSKLGLKDKNDIRDMYNRILKRNSKLELYIDYYKQLFFNVDKEDCLYRKNTKEYNVC